MNYKIRPIYTIKCLHDQKYASTIKICTIAKNHLTFIESRDNSWLGRYVSLKDNREIWDLTLDAVTIARSNNNIYSLTSMGTVRSYEASGKIDPGTTPIWQTNLSKVFKSMHLNVDNGRLKFDQDCGSLYVEVCAKTQGEASRYTYLFSLDLNGEIRWFTFMGRALGDTVIEYTKTSIIFSYHHSGKTIFGISKLTGRIEWMYSTNTGYDCASLYSDLNLLYITPMDTYRCIAEINTNTGEVLNNYFIYTNDRPGLTFLHRKEINGSVHIYALASTVGRYERPLRNSALMWHNGTTDKRLITARTDNVEIGYPFTSSYSPFISESMFLISDYCVKYSMTNDGILCRYINLTSGKSKISKIPLAKCAISAIFPIHDTDKHAILINLNSSATIGIVGPDCAKKIYIEHGVHVDRYSVRMRLFRKHLCFLSPTCYIYDLEEICSF